ncbi:MAG TPA: cytochrome c peroxidase [Candidatus Sulfomarinibacteraceae bacterium]|nr:cytochrome c peroxidase [Candidatus Sulfomarinibacteraceae bacterium]
MVFYLLLASIVTASGLLWHRQTAQQEGARLARAHQLRALVEDRGLQPLHPPPDDDETLVELGRLLFFDPILSGNRDVSCATCHDPALATVDRLPLAVGTGGEGVGAERTTGQGRSFVSRNTHDLFNRALPGWEAAFWDGRVMESGPGRYETPAGAYLPAGLDNLLAAQAMFPVTLRHEMRGGAYNVDTYTAGPGTAGGRDREAPAGWHDVDVYGRPNELAAIPDGAQHAPAIWEAVMARLLAIPQYEQLFRRAYPQQAVHELGFHHAANALAAFQADAFTFVDSPWNRYLAGDDGALSPQAQAGALLFFGEAGCAACHAPPLFTDHGYHNIGAPQFGPGHDAYAPLDFGRYHVTGDEADRYAFRTPSLLNVSFTAPYLHNGAYGSLEDVVRHHLQPEAALRRYEGRELPLALQTTVQNEPVTIDAILRTLDPELAPERELSAADVAALLAFLEALGDPRAAAAPHLAPEAVPSGLPLGR